MRKGSIRYVRSFVEKLQASLSHSKRVKEGHFVVIATLGWKPERFVVDLGCLNNPEFQELLKQAEEEFGFSQEGVLAIPCKPDELQYIISVAAPVGSSRGRQVGKRCRPTTALKQMGMILITDADIAI